MNMKRQELLDLIQQTCLDKEVATDTALTTKLFRAYRDLEDGKEVRLVCQEINNMISKYLILNKYKAPNALLVLAKSTEKDANSVLKGTGLSNLFR